MRTKHLPKGVLLDRSLVKSQSAPYKLLAAPGRPASPAQSLHRHSRSHQPRWYRVALRLVLAARPVAPLLHSVKNTLRNHGSLKHHRLQRIEPRLRITGRRIYLEKHLPASKLSSSIPSPSIRHAHWSQRAAGFEAHASKRLQPPLLPIRLSEYTPLLEGQLIERLGPRQARPKSVL